MPTKYNLSIAADAAQVDADLTGVPLVLDLDTEYLSGYASSGSDLGATEACYINRFNHYMTPNGGFVGLPGQWAIWAGGYLFYQEYAGDTWKINRYNPATGTFDQSVTVKTGIHADAIPAEPGNAHYPGTMAGLELSDGNLIFAAAYVSDHIFWTKTSTAYDLTTLSVVAEANDGFSGSYSYPWIEDRGVANTVSIYFRDGDSSTGNRRRTNLNHSTGVASAPKLLLTSSVGSPYVVYAYDSLNNDTYFVATTGNYGALTAGTHQVYAGYIDNDDGNLKTMAGTTVGSGPHDVSSFTLVDDLTGDTETRMRMTQAEIDGSGNLCVLLCKWTPTADAVFRTNAGNYWFAKYSGGSWTVTKIGDVSSQFIGTGTVRFARGDTTTVAGIDWENGVGKVFEWTTADGGATWSKNSTPLYDGASGGAMSIDEIRGDTNASATWNIWCEGGFLFQDVNDADWIAYSGYYRTVPEIARRTRFSGVVNLDVTAAGGGSFTLGAGVQDTASNAYGSDFLFAFDAAIVGNGGSGTDIESWPKDAFGKTPTPIAVSNKKPFFGFDSLKQYRSYFDPDTPGTPSSVGYDSWGLLGLTGLTGFTVVACCKLTLNGDMHIPIANWDANGTAGFFLRVFGDTYATVGDRRKVQFVVGVDAAPQFVSVVTAETVSPDAWVVLSASYDTTNGIRVYLNGTVSATTATANGALASSASTKNLYTGYGQWRADSVGFAADETLNGYLAHAWVLNATKNAAWHKVVAQSMLGNVLSVSSATPIGGSLPIIMQLLGT